MSEPFAPDPQTALVTAHFRLGEFACHDGTGYPFEWIADRLVLLCLTLEVIRDAAGGEPLTVISGYRTLAHNAAKGRKPTSQHVQGRAADITHPKLSAAQLHALVLDLWRAGKLPHLGGLGLYVAHNFIHVDVRPRVPADHLARWEGEDDAAS